MERGARGVVVVYDVAMKDPYTTSDADRREEEGAKEAQARAWAQEWRLGVEGGILLGRIGRAVCAEPFDAKNAERAWGKAGASWSEWSGREELDTGWHSLPWAARETRCDSGQAGNEHCGRYTLRHPLLAACRFGSAESMAWICSKPGIDPVVDYVDVARFWSFDRAARSGISGAFGPLWDLAVSNGWGKERLGEALAAWLIGVQDGPMGAVGASLSEASGALAWLMRGDPGYALPLAPASVFGSALGASIAHEGIDGEPTAEKTRALIGFAPASVWRHEAQMPDSETYEARQENPACARTFGEEALEVGNPEGLRLLMEAGHPMPSPERAWEVMGGAPPSEAQWKAYGIIKALAAMKESRELGHCAQEPGEGAPDGGMRKARAL